MGACIKRIVRDHEQRLTLADHDRVGLPHVSVLKRAFWWAVAVARGHVARIVARALVIGHRCARCVGLRQIEAPVRSFRAILVTTGRLWYAMQRSRLGASFPLP